MSKAPGRLVWWARSRGRGAQVTCILAQFEKLNLVWKLTRKKRRQLYALFMQGRIDSGWFSSWFSDCRFLGDNLGVSSLTGSIPDCLKTSSFLVFRTLFQKTPRLSISY